MLCESYTGFKTALLKTSDPILFNCGKAWELRRLIQSRDTVRDYASHFWTLAVESGWNDVTLYDMFLKGLATQIQELLLPLDLPTYLDR